MITNSLVLLVIAFFCVTNILTQKPPKVPELFLPDSPPPSPTQPDEAVLPVQTPQASSLQPYKISSESDKVPEIIELKEQIKSREEQTLLHSKPVLGMNDVKVDVKDDVKEVVFNITKESTLAMNEMGKKYNYQRLAATMYNQGMLNNVATSTATPLVCRQSSTAKTTPKHALKLYYPLNPSNVCPKPVKVKRTAFKMLRLTPATIANVCQTPGAILNYGTSYARKSIVTPNSLPSSNVIQRPVLGTYTWPVVPVTQVQGNINDNEALVVVYKPKTVNFLNGYGNIVRKTTSKILVPQSVSKLH